MAYSQVSQRYVPARRLRFVEAYEYRNDPEAHASFERWIDASAAEYQRREDAALERERLLNMASCDDEIGYVATPPTTEDRKRVRQAARRCLPNETEAPILVTGNLRALRHCIESRCSAHADVEIRRAFWRVLLILASVDPILWEDYTATQLPDGTWSVETPYRKV
jgi:thymidylate synthase (FAD)